MKRAAALMSKYIVSKYYKYIMYPRIFVTMLSKQRGYQFKCIIRVMCIIIIVVTTVVIVFYYYKGHIKGIIYSIARRNKLIIMNR